MACPGPPLCCPQCCTHRLFDPEIDWSDSIANKQICGTVNGFPPRVRDAWMSGDHVYLLAEIPRGPAGLLTHRYRVRKQHKDGTKIWDSAILVTNSDNPFGTPGDGQAAVAKVASDGTNVWAAVSGSSDPTATSTMFRLNASTGAVEYSGDPGAGDSLTVWALCPDGYGFCLIGHEYVGGFVSTWNDDVLANRFGADGCVEPGATLKATSITVDGDDIYVGHSTYAPRFFAGIDGPSCPAGGFVSRYNVDLELVWCSYGGAAAGPDQTFIAKSGLIYFVFHGGGGVGALETTWGVPQWVVTFNTDPMVDVGCGVFTTGVAVDSSVWVSVCRWIFEVDPADGSIISAVPHVHEADITVEEPHVLTVAATGDGTAIGGGRAVPCDPDVPLEPEERASTAATCDTFTPGCTNSGGPCLEFPTQTKPDWCHTNECGSITTNGRFAISECAGDLTQMPPCSGPGAIRYTQCEGGDVTESFTFTSECSSGGRTWTGEFTDGSVELEYICGDTFGPENVTLTISGCTITVTEASITCDGPFGYAVFNFSFSGTCGECEINGCGVFGAEDCEIPEVPYCECLSLPDEITATFSDNSGCTGFTGQTITLSWDAGMGSAGGWYGTGTIDCAGTTVELFAQCCFDVWHLAVASSSCFTSATSPLTSDDLTCTETAAIGPAAEAGGSCDPFEQEFILTTSGAACPCCAGPPGATYKVTLTA